MRLIDADALRIDFYDEIACSDDEYVYGYVSQYQIDSAPTIEPKRGEWIDAHGDDSLFRCSECQYPLRGKKYQGRWLIVLYNFCPNCGADMREREGE